MNAATHELSTRGIVSADVIVEQIVELIDILEREMAHSNLNYCMRCN